MNFYWVALLMSCFLNAVTWVKAAWKANSNFTSPSTTFENNPATLQIQLWQNDWNGHWSPETQTKCLKRKSGVTLSVTPPTHKQGKCALASICLFFNHHVHEGPRRLSVFHQISVKCKRFCVVGHKTHHWKHSVCTSCPRWANLVCFTHIYKK